MLESKRGKWGAEKCLLERKHWGRVSGPQGRPEVGEVKAHPINLASREDFTRIGGYKKSQKEGVRQGQRRPKEVSRNTYVQPRRALKHFQGGMTHHRERRRAGGAEKGGSRRRKSGGKQKVTGKCKIMHEEIKQKQRNRRGRVHPSTLGSWWRLKKCKSASKGVGGG